VLPSAHSRFRMFLCWRLSHHVALGARQTQRFSRLFSSTSLARTLAHTEHCGVLDQATSGKHLKMDGTLASDGPHSLVRTILSSSHDAPNSKQWTLVSWYVINHASSPRTFATSSQPGLARRHTLALTPPPWTFPPLTFLPSFMIDLPFLRARHTSSECTTSGRQHHHPQCSAKQ
jgi:hypothetical protein